MQKGRTRYKSCLGENMKNSKKATILAYLGIISVVIIWGVIPTFKKMLIGEHFSPALYSHMTALAGALALLLIFFKDLKKIDMSYIKIALPTGLLVGIASLLQAIAYRFPDASPTKQAFLENLSCIVVPVLLFIIIKKKPGALTISASILCLISSFVLADLFTTGFNFGVADIFNALAGIFYGVNIAITGIYAKKLHAPMYVMLQLLIQALFSYAVMIAFNLISVGDKLIEPIIFTPEPLLVVGVFAIGIVTNAVCWTIRTLSMKYVSANVVAVIMPFSAVVTGILSVALGMDSLSYSLVIGAILGLIASIMSSGDDILENKRKEKEDKTE